ncbi:D-xylose ABC transporter substrate-binding protein [Humitalea sp. 24SJ18S-53]|uniref:D-xylose ABC transporter substrate-binding protein n=1 Tax=Humitalea sp. 24SJ18S-53 TaxID=3422307 RepID=UPI003D66F65A
MAFGKRLLGQSALGALLAGRGAMAQTGRRLTVGVSWSNFQEERWRTDETAIRGALTAAGAQYLSADAQANNTKQLADIEGLLTRGIGALIVLAQDARAIQPAIRRAQAEGIPVVGYDRLIEVPGVFYLTFDNIEVGRMQAREVLKLKPRGNYVLIKGSSADPNADFLAAGQREVLKPAIDAGAVRIVAEQYTDGWRPEVAQRNMEQILTAQNNNVDAVLAANDGTAGGAIAALTAQGLAGRVPVSGQDADHAALNRIALGTQTVSVWKDSRVLGARAGQIAVALAGGAAAASVPGSAKWRSPGGVELDSILLTPVPIIRDNLGLVLEANWISRERLCRGVAAADAPPACRG